MPWRWKTILGRVRCGHCKNLNLFKHGDGRFALSVLPFPDTFGEGLNLVTHSILTQPQNSTRLQYRICGRLLASRVVGEERKDARPLGDDGLSLVTLPAVVNLAQCAELLCHCLLPQMQHLPSIAKMLAQVAGLVDHAFLWNYE